MSEYLKRVAKIEDDLQQRTAFHSSGNQVVVAGPGSGKTYLLTTKVAQTLLDGIVRFPQKVACITFSRQLAANLEMELRSLGVYDSARTYVGTVHAFCIAEIIMPVGCLLVPNHVPTPFRIASKKEILDALDRALKGQGEHLPQDEWTQRNIQSNIDKFRRLHFCPESGSFSSSRFSQADGYSRNSLADLNWSQLANDYVRNLIENNPGSVDFVCIEMLALQIVRSYPSIAMTLSAAYPWWFVDEYQDLSPLFHQLVTHLVKSGQVSLFAIGDPNQCIYEELHGSKPQFLKELAETVRQVSANDLVTLRTNYRSAQNIIDLGDVVLGENTGYKSSLQAPGICHVVEIKSSQATSVVRRCLHSLIDKKHIAVLSPTRAMLKSILQDLENDGALPVAIDKDPDYDANFELIAWVLDMAKWCSGGQIYFHELLPFWSQLTRVACGVHDERRRAELDQKLFEALWELRSGKLLIHDWLKSLVEKLDFASLMKPYELVRPDDVVELRDLYSAANKSDRLKRQSVHEFAQLDHAVFLTTLHGSKGLEFDAAVIVGLDAIRDSASVPELKSRLAYVAVTRARTHLYLLINESTSPLAESLARQSEYMLKYWYCKNDGHLMRKL